MFNEKSCGNCIKSWSKVFMWICTFLICLAGILAICQITAKTQKEVEILQVEYDSSWDSECEIAAVKNAAIRSIILIKNAATRSTTLIFIIVIVAIFVNRFFWGICFGFGIIVHSHSLI